MRSLKIVSRQSLLALWQADFVKQQLLQHYPNLEINIQGISTQGDNITNTPLNKIGGKGLFVKELEDSLLKKEADIAVHSMKDVPSILPDGLVIGAILERENPCDVFVSNQFDSWQSLPENASVGTSSLRREAQILHLRPDLQVKSLRGNVDTRLKKLDQNEYDAIILAYAGLKRLGLESRIKQIFTIDEMLPGIGQGALGIECRIDDEEVKALIQPLHDNLTGICVQAERQMNELLQGSCQCPIAGLAQITNDFPKRITLRGLVAEPKKHGMILNIAKQGNLDEAISIGKEVAKELKLKGADKIIADSQSETG